MSSKIFAAIVMAPILGVLGYAFYVENTRVPEFQGEFLDYQLGCSLKQGMKTCENKGGLFVPKGTDLGDGNTAGEHLCMEEGAITRLIFRMDPMADLACVKYGSCGGPDLVGLEQAISGDQETMVDVAAALMVLYGDFEPTESSSTAAYWDFDNGYRMGVSLNGTLVKSALVQTGY